MGLFTSATAAGATVVDIEAFRTIKHVQSVNTTTGEVTRYVFPFKLDGDEDFMVYTEKYKNITPFYGGNLAPVLFHCYGRIS